jgi:hypothetical protein
MRIEALATRAVRDLLRGRGVLADPGNAPAADVVDAAKKLIRERKLAGQLFVVKAMEADSSESAEDREERAQLAAKFAIDAEPIDSFDDRLMGRPTDDLATRIAGAMVHRPATQEDSKVTPYDLMGNRFKSKSFGSDTYGPDGAERDTMSLRVVNTSEKFSSERRAAFHTKTGKPVFWKGKQVEHPSDRELALGGALLSALCVRGRLEKLPDLWRNLVNEALDPQPEHVKASFLSDATSGGENLNLTVLDSVLWSELLLTNELLQDVSVVELPAGVGPTISSAILGPVSILKGSGAAEGSAATVFDATGAIDNADSTLAPWAAHATVGLDFLRWTPLDFMQSLRAKFSEKYQEELDTAIATGDGSAGVVGLFNSAGATIVPQQSPSPSGWDVNDIESCLAYLPRQYRKAGGKIRWVSNDRTYFRIRGVPVGTSDQRRVFGMDHGTYQVFDYEWRVNASVENTDLGLVDLRYFRLFRTPFGFRYTQEGDTLQRSNLGLLSARMHVAGRLVIGEAMAHFNAGPA